MNHYGVLGITSRARPEDIRRAYKAKALETHPDKLDPTASVEKKQASEAKFRRVQEAFEVLRDPVKRRAYDIQLGFRSSPSDLSEAQRARNQEREAWAQKSWQQYEDRFQVLKQRAAEAREQRMRQDDAEREYRAMVDRILDGLYSKNPEWKERHEQVKRPTRPMRSSTEP
ncbi:J domain-containing protein [Mycena kentingensis (nom. inval.)]|nr:J domain-containing protein [Mycena kentingensis (nom. inval.)]